MVQWSEAFWGEGNRGYDVLLNNVKAGAIAIEEFHRYLNESIQCESIYLKSLSRLQTLFIKVQYTGTFTPIWCLIRDLIEKICTTHLSAFGLYQELSRNIHSYQELYHKKIKLHIQKDGDISRTTDLIAHLNNALNTVNKAKELYYSIAAELDRAKRSGNSSSSASTHDSGSTSIAHTALHGLATRHLERLERKCRQAQDEYKLTIEKYNLVRNDYEKRFHDVCVKFQDFEIDHTEKLLAFSLNYSEILQRTSEKLQLAQSEFHDKLKALTGRTILDIFVEQKKTGSDRPVVLQFEEFDSHKTSTLSNNNALDVAHTHDASGQWESHLPSFEIHFASPTNSIRTSDPHGVSSPDSINTKSSPSDSMASNNSPVRSQETNPNDQTYNPFSLKIKMKKLPGIFGTTRRDVDEKKKNQKTSPNTKKEKNDRQRSRDESIGTNQVNSNHEINSSMPHHNDERRNMSSNLDKNKCPTPEPYTQSSSSMSSNDAKRYISPSAIPFSSSGSKESPSNSSNDSSSDDDDSPPLKPIFEIKPKTEVSPNADHDAIILSTMRNIGSNIGHPSMNKGSTTQKQYFLERSLTIESASTANSSLTPPIIPSRPATAIPNSFLAENTHNSNLFPPHSDFGRSFSISPDTMSNLNMTPIAFIDDDSEVANSFPIGDTDNKIASLSDLSKTPTKRTNLTQLSPSPVNHQSTSYSPILPNEQGISPMTIGALDQIPIAVAFQETIHTIMSGDNRENWKCRIVGEMLISFPSSILNLFTDTSRLEKKLEFRLDNIEQIFNIRTTTKLVTENQPNYSFEMKELHNTLRDLQEKSPSSKFFNIKILNYEVLNSNVSNIPIYISSNWSRSLDSILVNINYQFNSSAIPESLKFNKNSVIIYTKIIDAQQIKESSPNAQWDENEHKLCWTVPYVTNGTGSLTASLITKNVHNDADSNDEQEQVIVLSSNVDVYFTGENALFSPIDFLLTCDGYRVSLFKKKILSGKFQSEPDQNEPLRLFQRKMVAPSTIVN